MKYLLFNWDNVDDVDDPSVLTNEEFEQVTIESGGFILNKEEFETMFNVEEFSTSTHQLRIVPTFFDDNDFEGQDDLNSRLMESACFFAERITSIECEKNNVIEIVEDEHGTSYTEEAQDLFNKYYDEYKEELIKFFNSTQKEI